MPWKTGGFFLAALQLLFKEVKNFSDNSLHLYGQFSFSIHNFLLVGCWYGKDITLIYNWNQKLKDWYWIMKKWEVIVNYFIFYFQMQMTTNHLLEMIRNPVSNQTCTFMTMKSTKDLAFQHLYHRWPTMTIQFRLPRILMPNQRHLRHEWVSNLKFLLKNLLKIQTLTPLHLPFFTNEGYLIATQ